MGLKAQQKKYIRANWKLKKNMKSNLHIDFLIKTSWPRIDDKYNDCKFGLHCI